MILCFSQFPTSLGVNKKKKKHTLLLGVVLDSHRLARKRLPTQRMVEVSIKLD